MTRVRRKVRFYLENGVRLVWIIDPLDRSVTVMTTPAAARTTVPHPPQRAPPAALRADTDVGARTRTPAAILRQSGRPFAGAPVMHAEALDHAA